MFADCTAVGRSSSGNTNEKRNLLTPTLCLVLIERANTIFLAQIFIDLLFKEMEGSDRKLAPRYFEYLQYSDIVRWKRRKVVHE